MSHGEHAVLTGPIAGLITLDDGTVVNASPSIIYLETHEQALDAADKIGKHFAANGHPDDIEEDKETGQPVQRPFVYDETSTAAALTAITGRPASTKKNKD